jgi:hypothetical protein
MRKLFYFLLLSFYGGLLFAQQGIGSIISSEARYIPEEKTIFYRLGEKEISLRIQQYGNRNDIVFINLHDDESTSVYAAQNILETEGGMLIEVENDQQRLIRFMLGKYKFAVDPNRIFSRAGINKSLTEQGRNSLRAAAEVEKLGQRILQLIPEDVSCVIALHNNTPDFFSATDYYPGNKYTKEASKVYLNPKEDADDFFLTTDNTLYEKLANKGFNTILQNNKNCTEDGSLSVYCGKRNIRYVNCETEHGKTEQYFEMIKTLLSELSVKNQ